MNIEGEVLDIIKGKTWRVKWHIGTQGFEVDHQKSFFKVPKAANTRDSQASTSGTAQSASRRADPAAADDEADDDDDEAPQLSSDQVQQRAAASLECKLGDSVILVFRATATSR
jgi:hypothetical protein